MRHKLNLPKHPNILFLVIVFDIFALVVVYGLYSSNWVGESGIPVKLTSREAQNFPVSDNHLALKIFPAPANHCILGNLSVPFDQLEEELKSAQEERNTDQILLMTSKDASVETEREVIALLNKLDLSCILVTNTKRASSAPAEQD